jgi:hypothetical protein
MEPTGLDVVIRLYDPSELPRLCHCVFALLGQSLANRDGSCGPLRLHVMLRRFAFCEIQAVRTAVQSLRPLDETMRLTIHNWEHSEPFDLSVPLLNWGLEVTKGRYFSCLDIGDLVFPGAYATLLTRLRVSRAAVALGGLAAQPVLWWGDVMLPVVSTLPRTEHMQSGPRDPEAPFIFLLDRASLRLKDLVFQTGPAGTEVAEFVRRLRVCHPIDTEYLTELLAVRQVPFDTTEL